MTEKKTPTPDDIDAVAALVEERLVRVADEEQNMINDPNVVRGRSGSSVPVMNYPSKMLSPNGLRDTASGLRELSARMRVESGKLAKSNTGSTG